MGTFPLPKVVPVGGQAKASGVPPNPGPARRLELLASSSSQPGVRAACGAGQTRTRVPPGHAQ